MYLTRFYRIYLVTISMVICFLNQAIAQKTYFTYLQSENQQPFYVSIKGGNISSSSIGYVILSRLTDSTYPISIGFPGTNDVQEFDLTVNGSDQGYLIKNFGDKGWGLFNLQTLAVVMNNNEESRQKALLAAQKAEAEKKAADALNQEAARLAAIKKEDSIQLVARQQQTNAVTENGGSQGKPAVVETAIIKKEGLEATASGNAQQPKPAEVKDPASLPGAVKPAIENETSSEKGADSALYTKQLIKSDSVLSGSTAAGAVGQPLQGEGEAAPVQKQVVVSNTKDASFPGATDKPVGERVGEQPAITSNKKAAAPAPGSPVFLDMELAPDTNSKTETNPTVIKDGPGTDVSPKKKGIVFNPLPKSAGETPNNKKQKAGLTSNNSNTKIVTVPVPGEESTSTVKVAAANNLNNECKDSANEKDFFSLRKKMVSTEDTDEMINIAKKMFRDKCFSTEQVRNLCVLFLDDEGRYQFLDEAYRYTSDPANFRQLGDLIKDSYYLKRFNAMLR